jgi:RNA polymerase sigma-70 factor (ECF subfamily)
MTTSEEIGELLVRVGRQDKAAFDALYRATGGKLFGVALRILRRRDLAEDVLQEVFAKIWQRASEFDATRASAITWMSAIVRNRAIDELRRKPALSIDDLPDSLKAAAEIADPLGARERDEELDRLLACLEKLEGSKRQMVLFAYCYGLSREALAVRFGAPVPTIKTWLHRALAQLRLCLAP